MVTVAEAVERDLALLEQRRKGISESTLAATALALAVELDGANSATSKSMCARALNETMMMLRELAPEERASDRIDEISEKREARRARRAAS